MSEDDINYAIMVKELRLEMNMNRTEFCEYFGITGYIDDDHAEPDSEWEIILKTMEEYK